MDQEQIEFWKQQKEVSDYKKKREERYKLDSRDRLSKIIKKKIETTMIGAISSVEEHLGFLWGYNENQSNLNEDQKRLKELFQLVRSEILDKGNAQARNADTELSQYDVEWKKFTMVLPVRIGTKENDSK
jgi:hypothetical protein